MMEDESVACQADHSLDVNNADSSAPVTQLSKNQQKKQRRQEAARQRHVAKKAEEKAARKASQEKKLAEREQHIAQMTEEERQAWDQQTQGKRQVSHRSSSSHMLLTLHAENPLALRAAENWQTQSLFLQVMSAMQIGPLITVSSVPPHVSVDDRQHAG